MRSIALWFVSLVLSACSGADMQGVTSRQSGGGAGDDKDRTLQSEDAATAKRPGSDGDDGAGADSGGADSGGADSGGADSGGDDSEFTAPSSDDSDLSGGDLDVDEGESVSRSYYGGCVGVRHGGSSGAADRMNRSYSPEYEGKCVIKLNLGKDFGKQNKAKKKVEVEFAVGALPKPGMTWTDGEYKLTEKTHKCLALPAPFGPQTQTLNSLAKDYSDSDERIGTKNKGGKWIVAYDPDTMMLTLTATRNGWGKCRWSGNCGPCLDGIRVKLLP